jgi:glycine cleavage system H lipoate-binding protein
MNYTVTLTDTEKLAMEYVAYEPQDWVENAFKERARIAIDEIVKLAVEKFLAANQTIPGSKEEIVAAAYSNGWIQTLKYRTDNASSIPE